METKRECTFVTTDANAFAVSIVWEKVAILIGLTA